MDRALAVLVDRFADRCREGVDQAALDATGGDYAFPQPWYVVVQADGYVLQWRTGELAAQQLAPGTDLETAIARLQGRYPDPVLFQ